MYTHAQFIRGNKEKLIEIKRKPNTGNLKKRKGNGGKCRPFLSASPAYGAPPGTPVLGTIPASGKLQSPRHSNSSPRNSKRQKSVPKRFDTSAERGSSPRIGSKKCSSSSSSSSSATSATSAISTTKKSSGVRTPCANVARDKDGTHQKQNAAAAASMVMLLLAHGRNDTNTSDTNTETTNINPTDSGTASPIHRSLPLPSPATVPIEGTAPPNINISVSRSSDIDAEAVMLLAHAHSPRRTIEMNDGQTNANLGDSKLTLSSPQPLSPLSPRVAAGL